MLARVDELWINEGVFRPNLVDGELTALSASRLSKKKGLRSGTALWGAAASKLGIDKDKAREAGIGMKVRAAWLAAMGVVAAGVSEI
jgi:hypothetical protein